VRVRLAFFSSESLVHYPMTHELDLLSRLNTEQFDMIG